jgi:gamma-glutamyltranspeptidase
MKGTLMQDDWRSRAGTRFTTEKRPATGTRGMVVTNHPLASAAGAEMLAAGGNAVDGAIAALFTLTVVEPMMVGILGGGMAHLRLPDGRHAVIDGLSTAPAVARADMFTAAEPVNAMNFTDRDATKIDTYCDMIALSKKLFVVHSSVVGEAAYA